MINNKNKKDNESNIEINKNMLAFDIKKLSTFK